MLSYPYIEDIDEEYFKVKNGSISYEAFGVAEMIKACDISVDFIVPYISLINEDDILILIPLALNYKQTLFNYFYDVLHRIHGYNTNELIWKYIIFESTVPRSRSLVYFEMLHVADINPTYDNVRYAFQFYTPHTCDPGNAYEFIKFWYEIDLKKAADPDCSHHYLLKKKGR